MSDVKSEQGGRGQRRLLITSKEEINAEELRFSRRELQPFSVSGYLSCNWQDVNSDEG